MTERRPRQYTKRKKTTVMVAALATNPHAAAEAHGVPDSTVRYWLESDEFATLRDKTREQIGEGARALSVKILGEINRRLPEFEPRDLTVLYGVLTDKSQLLTGQATGRTEHRDLTAELSDHETDAIESWLHDLARDRMEEADAG